MIFGEIKRELDEINSLLEVIYEKRANRDHVSITDDIKSRISHIGTLAAEQHALINARLTITSTTDIMETARTYADVLKQSSHTNSKSARQHKSNEPFTVLVKCKTSNGDSVKTTSELKRKINPAKLGVNVSRIKQISNGGVAITVCDNSSAVKLTEAICAHDVFEAKQAKKTDPYIRVLNVPADISNEDIIAAISESTTAENCKLAFQNRIKNTDLRNVAIQLSPDIWDSSLRKKYVCVAWQRLRVIDFIPVRRCYKCQTYGHVAAKCKETRQICPWCSRFHGVNECLSTLEYGQCINCIRSNANYNTRFDVNHAANSNQCSVFKYHRLKKINSTNYSCKYN